VLNILGFSVKVKLCVLLL